MNPESILKLVLQCVVIALFGAHPVDAQSPSTSSAGGIWWEVSAAAGGARLTCEVCEPERELGPSLGAAIGAYANPRLRVGIEGGGWTHLDEDIREYVYRAGITAQLHPRPTSGLYVVGGIGWSGYRAESFTYDAFRLTVGAGWDLPLTGSLIAGNRITLDGSSYASLKNGGTSITGTGGEALAVGLSVLRFEVYVRRR